MSKTWTNLPATMKAYRLHGVGDLRLEEVAVPRPGPGQVLIAVSRVGICGSDVHYFTEGRCGSFVVRHPFIPGHEFAGRVVGLGPGVDTLEVGQRVAVDPSRPCGRCVLCRAGRTNLCRSMRYFGTASVLPHADGAMAQYVAAPAANCHRLDDRLDDGQAAALEPTAIALHALERAGQVRGRSVLILGGGTIGQLALLLGRAMGARWLGLSDVRAVARGFARDHGADAVFDPSDRPLAEQLADVGAAGDLDGAEVVLECAGAGPAVADALACAAVGATVVQVGTVERPVPVPVNRLMNRELAWVGSFRFADSFAKALAMVRDGQVKVEPVISDVLPFEAMDQAMERACSGRGLKIQVEVCGQGD